jgi:hypothetical protein
MTEQKTHDVRDKPGMSANRLADYMAASEQSKRSILRGCKYRPRARVVQHQDAKDSIADWLSSGDSDPGALQLRSETLRNGLFGSDFDNEVAEHNADYIDRFLKTSPALPIKAQQITKAGRMPALDLDGFSLSFSPDLILKRVNKRNVPKMGVAFFRYSKGKPLSSEVACWQGAISMGYLTTKLKQGLGDVDPEGDLCVALDMWSGQCHSAPTNAVYRFNEVRAACAGIVERWAQIPPPENAVL